MCEQHQVPKRRDNASPNQTVEKFSLGRIVATPGALEALTAAGQSADEFLARHACGEWGELDHEDCEANDAALIDGSRILSAYKTRKGECIWIITEAADDQGHRSSSTLLLPREY
jgi:hypothetical protein